MGYCKHIDAICPASNDALKCAKTKCPHPSKEKPDAGKED